MTERGPTVGMISCYFGLYEEQMPPGFRADRQAAAARCADVLRTRFETVDAGMSGGRSPSSSSDPAHQSPTEPSA